MDIFNLWAEAWGGVGITFPCVGRGGYSYPLGVTRCGQDDDTKRREEAGLRGMLLFPDKDSDEERRVDASRPNIGH